MTEPEREAREAALKFALDYPSFGGAESIFERAEKYRRFLMGEPTEPRERLCK